jgi:hypothetical protein
MTWGSSKELLQENYSILRHIEFVRAHPKYHLRKNSNVTYFFGNDSLESQYNETHTQKWKKKWNVMKWKASVSLIIIETPNETLMLTPILTILFSYKRKSRSRWHYDLCVKTLSFKPLFYTIVVSIHRMIDRFF